MTRKCITIAFVAVLGAMGVASEVVMADEAVLIVEKDGARLGVIDLRGSGKPVLLKEPGANTQKLEADLAALVKKGGLAVKMHIPRGDGERGPLGSVMMKPGDDGYSYAMEEELQRLDYEVEHGSAFPALKVLPKAKSGAIGTLTIYGEDSINLFGDPKGAAWKALLADVTRILGKQVDAEGTLLSGVLHLRFHPKPPIKPDAVVAKLEKAGYVVERSETFQ